MIIDKQKILIHNIESVLNIKFDGTTKNEARSFINNNLIITIKTCIDNDAQKDFDDI